jgi:ubiquinone/menaquinone biosynthesis C-methylase UbiE
MCLEFSHVENPLLSAVYDFYSHNVIPPMGQLLASMLPLMVFVDFLKMIGTPTSIL